MSNQDETGTQSWATAVTPEAAAARSNPYYQEHSCTWADDFYDWRQKLELLRDHELVVFTTDQDVERGQEAVPVTWTQLGALLLGTVGSLIRSLREQQDMTQKQLAKRLLVWNRHDRIWRPCSPGTVSRRESGRFLPEPAEILQLADLFPEHADPLAWFRLGSRPYSDFSAKQRKDLKQRARILMTAKEAVREAGAMLLKDYWSALDGLQITSDPEVRNPATEANDASFECMEAIIRRLPGRHLIAGEQRGEWRSKARDGDTVWILAAIDGTISFVNGLPLWCVAAGVGTWHQSGENEHLEPVCGAVFDPCLGELFYALAGGGAMLEQGRCKPFTETPLCVSQGKYIDEAVLGTHLSATHRAEMESFVKSGLLAALCVSGRRVLMLGSGQLALCYVAAGRLEAFFNSITRFWNVFAGKIIVEAAAGGASDRGIVTDGQGKDYTHNSRSVLASCSRAIHTNILSLIKSFSP